jgi:hypothetical protein
MAAENNTDSNTDAAVTDGSATTPATKRKYAPRRPKAAVDMMGGMTDIVTLTPRRLACAILRHDPNRS